MQQIRCATFVAMIALSACPVRADTMAGKVWDFEKSRPMVQVSITVKPKVGKKWIGQTDGNGKYRATVQSIQSGGTISVSVNSRVKTLDYPEEDNPPFDVIIYPDNAADLPTSELAMKALSFVREDSVADQPGAFRAVWRQMGNAGLSPVGRHELARELADAEPNVPRWVPAVQDYLSVSQNDIQWTNTNLVSAFGAFQAPPGVELGKLAGHFHLVTDVAVYGLSFVKGANDQSRLFADFARNAKLSPQTIKNIASRLPETRMK